MDEETHGQLKAAAWRTLKAVDHVDAKAADEGLTISPDWRAWRGEVRAVIRGNRMDIPPEPARYLQREEPSSSKAEEAPELRESMHDPRDEALASAYVELAAMRRRVAELEAQLEPPPLSPHPDELMSDYGPVGEDAITGDMLLDAFEADAVETAAVVKTLSATRLKHLSEQLNVERARLDREHQATGIANPRSASIDRLLGLLTRRGEV